MLLYNKATTVAEWCEDGIFETLMLSAFQKTTWCPPKKKLNIVFYDNVSSEHISLGPINFGIHNGQRHSKYPKKSYS